MSVSTTKAPVQNPTPEDSIQFSVTHGFENRISKTHILLTGFPKAAIQELAGGQASFGRAERVKITGGVAERRGGSPFGTKEKKMKAHPAYVAKRNNEDAKRSARRVTERRSAQRDNAYTIATDHLHYHGNDIWSHQRPHPDSA